MKLEVCYVLFDGLNLCWEIVDGLIKYNGLVFFGFMFFYEIKVEVG